MGSTLHGKIGIPGAKFNQIVKPKMFPLSKDRCVILVQCSEFHTICLFEDGEVFSWGGTLHKKLGTGSAEPSLVAGLNKVAIKKVGCGRYHSMALSSKFWGFLTGRYWTFVFLGRRGKVLQQRATGTWAFGEQWNGQTYCVF